MCLVPMISEQYPAVAMTSWLLLTRSYNFTTAMPLLLKIDCTAKHEPLEEQMMYKPDQQSNQPQS